MAAAICRMLMRASYLKQIKRGLVVFALCVSATHASEITPSHVYQRSEQLLLAVQQIRSAEKITAKAKVPSVQIDKSPLQVYVKSLEVRTKVAYLQRKYKLQPLPAVDIPLRNIAPKEVYQSLAQLQFALQPIQQRLGVETLPQVPFIKGKTPANVYENLWKVSYSLDELVGSISPNLVYQNMLYALEDTRAIAQKLNVGLISKGRKITENVNPISPNIEGFKNLYRLARIERKLKLKAVKIRPFPSGEISPSDVYDTTNNILAELVRLKVAQGITEQHSTIELPQNKRPADVLEKMRLLGVYLESIEQTI